MTTYYINADTGNDSTGDGSSGNPWKTPGKAVTGSGVDEIIFQAATATYTFSDFTFNSSAITFRAENFNDAIIDGGGVTTSTWRFGGSVLTLNIENLIFRNIEHTSSDRVFYHSHAVAIVGTITNCMFHNITTYGSSGNIQAFWGREATAGSEDMTFINCAFYDLDSNTTADAIFSLRNTSGSWTLRNCTFDFDVLPAAYYVVFGDLATAATVTIEKCIFNNRSGGTINLGPTSNVTYDSDDNTYYNMTNVPSGTNDTTSDPLLVDPDNGILDLRADSPARAT